MMTIEEGNERLNGLFTPWGIQVSLAENANGTGFRVIRGGAVRLNSRQFTDAIDDWTAAATIERLEQLAAQIARLPSNQGAVSDMVMYDIAKILP